MARPWKQDARTTTILAETILVEREGSSPRNLRLEVEGVLGSGSPTTLPADAGAVRAWVKDHRHGTAAVVAALLEEALSMASGSESAPKLRAAKALAREWEAQHGGGELLERAAIYAKWAASPAMARRKREIDASIRRDLILDGDTFGELAGEVPHAELERRSDEAIRDYGELGDTWGQVECLLRKGWLAHATGRDPRGLLDEALELSRLHAYPQGEGLVRLARAQHAVDTGDLESAVRREYVEASGLLQEVQFYGAALIAENDCGFHCLRIGSVAEGLEHLQEARSLARRFGSTLEEGVVMVNLAWAHDAAGKAKESLDAALAAGEVLDRVEPARPLERSRVVARGRSRWRAARAELALGRADRALERAGEAEAIAAALVPPDSNTLSRAANISARAQLAAGRLEAALEAASRAVELADDRWWRGEAQATKGIVLLKLGREGEAVPLLLRALETLGDLVQDRHGAEEVRSVLKLLLERQFEGVEQELERVLVVLEPRYAT